MLIKGINFPDELMAAHDSGDLAVFAGAGVSCGKPSDLPSFESLAGMIGESSGLNRENNEPPDRYLGRLADAGVCVHQRAAQALVGAHTEPRDLHYLLLQVFGSRDRVRLVTTNFDTHFTLAAKELFQQPPEIFVGPALPLGEDFRGIVYLHG